MVLHRQRPSVLLPPNARPQQLRRTARAARLAGAPQPLQRGLRVRCGTPCLFSCDLECSPRIPRKAPAGSTVRQSRRKTIESRSNYRFSNERPGEPCCGLAETTTRSANQVLSEATVDVEYIRWTEHEQNTRDSPCSLCRHWIDRCDREIPFLAPVQPCEIACRKSKSGSPSLPHVQGGANGGQCNDLCKLSSGESHTSVVSQTRGHRTANSSPRCENTKRAWETPCGRQ